GHGNHSTGRGAVMPVAFSCPECGKQLNVRDDLAGKRIKCPGCGAVVSVPDSDGPPPSARVKAGRSEAASARKLVTKPQRSRDEDEDDDESSDRKSGTKGRRPLRKTGSNRGLIISLCVGGGVLVLAAVLTIVLWPKKQTNNADTVASSKTPGDDTPPAPR